MTGSVLHPAVARKLRQAYQDLSREWSESDTTFRLMLVSLDKGT